MNLKHNERQFVFCRHREDRSLRLSLDNPKLDPIPRYSEIPSSGDPNRHEELEDLETSWPGRAHLHLGVTIF